VHNPIVIGYSFVRIPLSLQSVLIPSAEIPYKYIPRPPSIVSHNKPPLSSEKLSNLDLLAMADKAVVSYGTNFDNIPSDDSKAFVLAQPKPLTVVPPKPLAVVPPK
jgi:hypothetical protein